MKNLYISCLNYILVPDNGSVYKEKGMLEDIAAFLMHRANTVLGRKSGSSELQMESPLSSEFSF